MRARPAPKFVAVLAPVAAIAVTAVIAILLNLSRPFQAVELGSIVPAQADWVDCGQILAQGAEGDWDRFLWGGFANTVVKKDGVFYLYYQGASGYDEEQGTVTQRAIGVATSADGFTFTKHEQNPVLTWSPKNHLEEGAVSGGGFLDGRGNVNIYYGANSWVTGERVNANGRLAISSDGFTFVDQGIALDHADFTNWGWGDELFPIIGFQHEDRYFTYYIPNGALQKGRLGVAWDHDPLHLDRSSAAREGLRSIPVWGPGSSARVDSDTYFLFLNNLYAPNGHALEVRAVSTNNPAKLSAPLAIYQFDNVRQASVVRDEVTGRWFMFYRSAEQDYYGVMIAAEESENTTCGAAS